MVWPCYAGLMGMLGQLAVQDGSGAAAPPWVAVRNFCPGPVQNFAVRNFSKPLKFAQKSSRQIVVSLFFRSFAIRNFAIKNFFLQIWSTNWLPCFGLDLRGQGGGGAWRLLLSGACCQWILVLAPISAKQRSLSERMPAPRSMKDGFSYQLLQKSKKFSSGGFFPP